MCNSDKDSAVVQGGEKAGADDEQENEKPNNLLMRDLDRCTLN
jgi:hypothetical protein